MLSRLNLILAWKSCCIRGLTRYIPMVKDLNCLCVKAIRSGTPLIRFDIDKVAQGVVTSLVTPIVSIGRKKLQITAPANGRINAGAQLAGLSSIDTGTINENGINKAVETTVEQQISLALENGLHVRLKATGERHHAKIIIRHNSQKAEANHLTALLNLGLMPGNTITVIITGPHAQKTAIEVKKFLETPEGITACVVQQPIHRQPHASKDILYGVVASPGYGLGPLRRFTTSLPEIIKQGKTGNWKKRIFSMLCASCRKTWNKRPNPPGTFSRKPIFLQFQLINLPSGYPSETDINAAQLTVAMPLKKGCGE